MDLEKTKKGVIVSTWIYDQPPSAYYNELLKFKGNCYRKQPCEMFIPGIALSMSNCTFSATSGRGKPPFDKTYINILYNFITPVDEYNTQYVWFQHRNTDPADAAISENECWRENGIFRG